MSHTLTRHTHARRIRRLRILAAVLLALGSQLLALVGLADVSTDAWTACFIAALCCAAAAAFTWPLPPRDLPAWPQHT